jgi:hypothetical protein
MACYEDTFTSYMQMMFVPYRKHTYGPPRTVTGIALLVYKWMMFIPHRKHTYVPPRLVIWLLCYICIYR